MRVLIISEEEDFHSKIVGHRLSEMGIGCLVWNTSWHPWRDAITWTSVGERAVEIDGDRCDLMAFRSIWWRRFGTPVASPEVSDATVGRFVRAEASVALRGLLQSHPRVHNPIWAEAKAANKVHQLDLAVRCGLLIPQTVISNDVEAIRRFADRNPRCIIKSVFGDYPHGIATRRLTEEDLRDDGALSTAPSIIQEEVLCTRDVRVTIVGSDVYAAELARDDAAEEVDWRKSPHGWQRHDLPEAVVDKIEHMTRLLGLHMASFDLRLDPDGNYVFFEVNPSGQFMFLEIDAGLPISGAVARLLSAEH